MPAPSPLRVLYVHPFTERISGPDESLLVLLDALGPRVEATVALPPRSPFRERYLRTGARLVEQPISRLRRTPSPRALAAYARDLASSTRGLVRTGRATPFDLVHANMEVSLEAGLAARALGVPCVFHYRGNTLDEPRAVFDVLVRTWTTLGDHVFAISEGCADIFRRRGVGNRVEVLSNAVDLARSNAPVDVASVRASLGVPAGSAMVLTVGRIHPRKDVGTFVRAAALVHATWPDAYFVVAGSSEQDDGGGYEREVRQLAHDLGVGGHVRFVGARDDVPALLAACDVFVMTSRHEGFGRSVAEAMAAGRACVLSDEGAFPELVADGACGRLVPATDAPAFASTIGALLDDAGERERLGRDARVRARRHYAPDAQADRVLDVYRALVARRPVPPPAHETRET